MWWGCQEYMPVAQTLVLRRVLKGGISTNRCLVAHAGSEYGLSVPSGVVVLESGGDGLLGSVWHTVGS